MSFKTEYAVVDFYWFIMKKLTDQITDKRRLNGYPRPTLTWFPIEMNEVRVIVGNLVNDGYFRYGRALNIYLREK